MTADEVIYDVGVIGSGPGGYTAAIRAAQLGLKACVIERDEKLGGTCLLVGCIPTKALLCNAEVYDRLKAGKDFGIEGIAGATVNWGAVQARKNKIVQKHTKGLDFLMRKNRIDVIKGYGRLTGPRDDGVLTVDVEGSRKIRARNVILATGSAARMLPGLKPDATVLSNVEILSLGAIPSSLVVIGAGAVGVEFASIFRSFDCDVTILEMLPRLVPLEDEDISKELTRAFRRRGIKSFVSAKVEDIGKTNGGVAVTFTPDGGNLQTIEAEKIFIAVGRAPNTANIGMEMTKIRAERGLALTDEWMQTDEPGVYAVGDMIAGFPQLAHVAFMQGMVAAAHIAGRPGRPLDRYKIPNCIYCDPQISSVGLTETQARESGRNITVGSFPFLANSKASIVGSPDGFVKVVADINLNKILGVQIIGPGATEMIAEAVVAIEAGVTIDNLMFTIHPHPTLSEAIFDGIESVTGLSINI